MYLYMDTKILNYFLIFAIAILIFLNILANNNKGLTEAFQANNKNIESINNSIANNASKKNNAVNTAINNTVNNEGNTSTNSVPDTNKLRDMMEALSNSEALCDELEKRQENKDLLEQYEINKNTIQELDNQRRRIEELRRVLNQVRKEKAQRDVVVNKCRSKTQDALNNDYTIVKKLSDKGLLKDTSLKVNLNVSDQLKRNLSGIKKTSNNNNNSNVYANESYNNGNNVNNGNNSNNIGFSRVNTRRSPNKNVGAKINNSVNSVNTNSNITRRKIRRCKGIDTDKFIHANKIRGKCVGCDVDKLLEKNDYLKKDFA